MPAGAEVFGVDVDAMFASAMAEPAAGRASAFCEAFAAAFPAPELVITIGDTTRYLAPFTGELSGSAAGVAAPALGPPTVNVESADVAELGGTVSIRSSTFPSRRIVAPVAAASASGDSLVLSPPLDGAAALITTGLGLMLPPAGLTVVTSTVIDDVTLIGDSLFRGDASASPPFLSPAQRLRTLLQADGHPATFVGNIASYPGDVPVCANGGRTIADIDADIPNVVAAAPKVIVLQIGTNVLSFDTPDIGTQITNYLNKLDGALPSGTLYFIFAPNNLSYFHQASWTLLRNAMQTWCGLASNRHFGNLTDAGFVFADYSDGHTHWLESGANKAAAYMHGVMTAAVP